jgi:hypothetical protein
MGSGVIPATVLRMEILTNILTEEQVRQELADTMLFLSQRGISEVAVSFAFTPDSPDLDDVGVCYTVPIADLLSFVTERERTNGFRLGRYDCWIEPSGFNARFRFCNDRDIHVTSESAEVLDSVRARWRTRGFQIYPNDLGKV